MKSICQKPLTVYAFIKPMAIALCLTFLGCDSSNRRSVPDITANPDSSSSNRAAAVAGSALILPPKPMMWVDMNKSKERDDSVAWKFSLLKEHNNGIEDTREIFIPKLAMIQLLSKLENVKGYEYLRIYLGTFPNAQSDEMPDATYRRKLALVFAAVDADMQDLNRYFIVRDSYVDVKEILNDAKEKLRNGFTKGSLFKKSKLRALEPSIKDLNNKDNLFDKKYSDTKSILYCRQAINELVHEFDILENHPDEHRIKVAGLELRFAAYGSNGADDDKPKGRFPNRLITQFEYAKEISGGMHEIFYLDTTFQFSTRGPAVVPPACMFNYKSGVEANAMDKGQLCPPNCPPGT